MLLYFCYACMLKEAPLYRLCFPIIFDKSDKQINEQMSQWALLLRMHY